MEVDQPMDDMYLDPTPSNQLPQTQWQQQEPQIQTVPPPLDTDTQDHIPVPGVPLHLNRENFRDIPVKIHIRRPERDSWVYLGRGVVSQEVYGQSSRVVVKSSSSHKVLTTFGEGSALQAEKRGNFVVIGCVDGARVVSWSLNALNNSETLRLLASIEIACYACKAAVVDPPSHSSYRRRIARVIKDDRKKRHRRRKDQDALISAFARTGLNEGEPMIQQ